MQCNLELDVESERFLNVQHSAGVDGVKVDCQAGVGLIGTTLGIPTLRNRWYLKAVTRDCHVCQSWDSPKLYVLQAENRVLTGSHVLVLCVWLSHLVMAVEELSSCSTTVCATTQQAFITSDLILSSRWQGLCWVAGRWLRRSTTVRWRPRCSGTFRATTASTACATPLRTSTGGFFTPQKEDPTSPGERGAIIAGAIDK